MNQKLSKNFFLISFLPAIAYWYLEANYPVRIAVLGGLILAIIEILVEWIFTKHVHTLSKFNFFLIAFLGGVSLLGDEGIWFKLQPAFTGVGISLFLAFRLWRGRGLLLEMMESFPQKKHVPEFLIKGLEVHVSVLFFCYGMFMGFIAFKATTDSWLFFKTIGFYIIFFVFLIFEMIFMRFKMSRHMKARQRQELFKQL